MKTGLLNKRIEILGKKAVTDEYGFDTHQASPGQSVL